MEKCLHPLLEKREGNVFREKIQAEMKKREMEYLVLTIPANVFYATGYIPLIGSTIAVIPADGFISLIISTLESADAYCTTKDIDVREYPSWVFIDDGSPESRREKGDIMDPDAPVNMTLDIICKKPLEGKVGVEMGAMSKHFWEKLTAKLPESVIVDGSGVMREVRVIKTPWEIEMLRIAAQHLERTFECVAADLKPGMPAWKLDALFTYYAGKENLDLGTMGRTSIFIPAAGPYFGLSGVPRGYILEEGDVIKFDVGFQHLGYHSDIARTFAVGGTASDAVQEVYDVLYKANRLGVSMLKPGVKCSEIYNAVRADVEKSSILPEYPRGHVGHSVGCWIGPEEHPTLWSGTDVVIQPNMVFCLETPYSATGNAPVIGGFNLEDTHVITENGCESFTTMPDNIFWK